MLGTFELAQRLVSLELDRVAVADGPEPVRFGSESPNIDIGVVHLAAVHETDVAGNSSRKILARDHIAVSTKLIKLSVQ